MNENRIFSENLKVARKEKNFTQDSMAEKLEVPQKRYAAWEEGRGAPNLFYLSKICEVLEVDDLYLFISQELAKEITN